MRTMARSILVTETFIAATKARIGAADDSAALTLMSTDIERIKMGFRTVHDVWAAILQAAIAAWMLYIRLGLVFLVPIGVVTVCFVFLGLLMKYAGDSQRAWMAGVQKRVGLTATVIASMKNLKISGLSTVVKDFVQNLRVEELAGGARFRKIYILAAISGFCPLLLGPPLTFASAHQSLNTTKLFTSVSWLMLMTYPLQTIFSATPELLSGLACIGRIQSFLECETRQDFRQVLADIRLNEKRIGLNGSGVVQAQPNLAHPIVVQNGNFGWKSDKCVLRNINTRVSKSSLTLVVGPVGSGKSTLCNALLGEIPFSEGSTVLSTRFPRVGFCDQTAFLSNRSVKDNIIGFSSFDQERYTEVIEATSLGFDISTLPQGGMTIVGSDGITLSGGQKQRVSLARALYLQSDLLILDDVFSGLDANTEEKVFRQVFGPDGLLRKRGSTVILCTHSVRHLHAADHIIALVDGTITEQGSFEQLMSHDGYVQSLGLKDSVEASFEITKPQRSAPQSERQVLDRTTTTDTTPFMGNEDLSRQLGDKTVYKHYIKSMGALPAASCMFFAALWGFFTNFATICELPFYHATNSHCLYSFPPYHNQLILVNIGLKYWSDDSLKADPTHPYAYYAGIYALIQLSAMISLILLAIVLLVFAVKRVGANLHRDALSTLIRAPLRFFTTTDTGVVTNLFSQDLNLVDTELPDSLLNFLFCVSRAAKHYSYINRKILIVKL
jgi:ABC-type multidrug transport system fused ATPase/permease subunit